MTIDVQWRFLHEPYPRVGRSRDDRYHVDLPRDMLANPSARRNDLDAVSREDLPSFQVKSLLGLGLRLVRTMYSAKSGLPNSEGVGRRQRPVEHLVRRLQPAFAVAAVVSRPSFM